MSLTKEDGRCGRPRECGSEENTCDSIIKWYKIIYVCEVTVQHLFKVQNGVER